jgi:hypothetical protein
LLLPLSPWRKLLLVTTVASAVLIAASAARAYFSQGLALQRQLNNQAGIARVLKNLGAIALDQGDYRVAESYYGQSVFLEVVTRTRNQLEDSAFSAAWREGQTEPLGQSLAKTLPL